METIRQHFKNKPIGEFLSRMGLLGLLTYFGTMLALAALYYLAPDVKAFQKTFAPIATSAFAGEIALAEIGCSRFREYELDHLGMYAAVFMDRHAGCSMLSRQLAKNVYLFTRKSLPSKLEEALMAMRLENELGKKEILSLYLASEDWRNRPVQRAKPPYDQVVRLDGLDGAAADRLDAVGGKAWSPHELNQLVREMNQLMQTPLKPSAAAKIAPPTGSTVRETGPAAITKNSLPSSVSPKKLARTAGTIEKSINCARLDDDRWELTVDPPLEREESTGREKMKKGWRKVKAWAKKSWRKVKTEVAELDL